MSAYQDIWQPLRGSLRLDDPVLDGSLPCDARSCTRCTDDVLNHGSAAGLQGSRSHVRERSFPRSEPVQVSSIAFKVSTFAWTSQLKVPGWFRQTPLSSLS